MDGAWPEELLVALTFAKEGEKTRFTLCHEGIPGKQVREMCGQSWNESFDKLLLALGDD